jgi:hypothetical protein
MNQLVGLLSPGLLVRSLFSGVFFIVAFVIARDGSPALATSALIHDVGTFLLFSLVAGVTAYTLHRSLTFAVLEWILNADAAAKWRSRIPLISDATIEVLLRQWKGTAEIGKERQEVARHLSTWGDYIHLQYTSALCIALGACCGRLAVCEGGRVYWPIAVVALLFVLAALVANWRVLRIREYIVEHTGS